MVKRERLHHTNKWSPRERIPPNIAVFLQLLLVALRFDSRKIGIHFDIDIHAGFLAECVNLR
jgi:hypothetical protein